MGDSMKVCMIVQARMTSERLPGKVLKEVLGKPLIEYEIERLKRVPGVDEIIVATTTNATDDPVVAVCKRLSVASFRGSEHDVLSRYHGAAKAHKADIVIRVCADCPIIDPEIIAKTLNFYLEHQNEYDHVSNTMIRHFPRGLDCEIFSFKVLDEAFAEARHPYEREHVTPFIHDQPARYRMGGVTLEEDLSGHRWTVDTIEDFELIQEILTALYPTNPFFGMNDVTNLIKKNPEWKKINAHIQQKPEQPVR